MQLSDDAVHVEGFATAAWAQTKEVGVVSQFVSSFLTGDVNGYGNALSVGVVYLQGGVLALLEPFLIHQAGCGIAKGQETVVLVTHGVTVAGKGVDEEFQLVVGLLGDMNTDTAKDVLNVVGGLLWVNILLAGDDQVVMGIDELLVFTSNHVLHPLDVFHGNQVAGTGHTGMTVLLGLQLAELFLLIGDIYHLIEDHGLGIGDAIDNGHHIHWHRGVVHFNVCVGTDETGDGG